MNRLILYNFSQTQKSLILIYFMKNQFFGKNLKIGKSIFQNIGFLGKSQKIGFLEEKNRKSVHREIDNAGRRRLSRSRLSGRTRKVVPDNLHDHSRTPVIAAAGHATR